MSENPYYKNWPFLFVCILILCLFASILIKVEDEKTEPLTKCYNAGGTPVFVNDKLVGCAVH